MKIIKLCEKKPPWWTDLWTSNHVALNYPPNQVAVVVKINFDGKGTHLCKNADENMPKEYLAVRIVKRVLEAEEIELHTGEIVETCHVSLSKIESYILFYQAIKEDMQGG